MQITPTPPEPTPRALPGASGGAAKSHEGGFAALLGQKQAAPAEATREPDDSETGAPTTPAADKPAPRSRVATRETAPRSATASRQAEARTEREAEEMGSTDRPANPDAAPLDPALAHWLAGLHLPAPDAAPTPATGKAAAGALTKDRTELAASTLPASDPRAAALRADARAETRGAATAADPARIGNAGADARGERFADEIASAVAERDAKPQAAESPSAPQRHEIDASSLQAAAAAPASAARSDGTPAPVDMRIAPPVDSPEFAQAFGVQVSVLARDGIQQAELHLNPAEMGPVSVQIALEGTQARVDFGADAAATRHAIEQSLPELAAALRDAGFTLSGGGVSQHAAGGDGQAGRDPSEPHRPSERAAVDAAAAPRRPWRGTLSASGVDLYA